ncbi:MAG: response regulator [Chloroflexota bacterium]
MRVLIVDDHVLFRQGLVSLFQPQPNFQVVGEAGSVREAIEKNLQVQPELVLMDFCLPDGTGLDAAEQILAVRPRCQVVFLTVQEDDETLFNAIRKGASGFLLKNLPLSRLLASLEAVQHGEPALSPELVGRIFREFARTERASHRSANPLGHLSQREAEILHELTTGATNQEIAQRLFLAENTVKHHVHNILDKLDLENRRQAAYFARQNGL